MAEAFSEEELEDVRQCSGKGYGLIVQRLLTNLEQEYREQIKLQRAITELKEKRTADEERFMGYIEDYGEQKRKFQKRIEELEQIKESDTAIKKDHRVKMKAQTATIERLRGALEPVWIVNDIAELGVKIGGRFFFLYKGGNIEYDTHDNGTPMKYRIVGKREFGETCQPKAYFDNNYHLTESGLYTEPLVYHEGLSDGKPEDGEWKQLPARQALDAGKE